MFNVNPETGIRYGYIAAQQLHDDVVHNLMYGAHAVDHSYNGAYNEAKLEAEREYDGWLEEAGIAAAETDYHMSASELAKFVENWMAEHGHPESCEDHIDNKLENFGDGCNIDEPIISGEMDGVKYRTSWLGGALNFWIFESPHTTRRDLCSPCVPGAVNLDTFPHGDGYEGYDVPADWRADHE